MTPLPKLYISYSSKDFEIISPLIEALQQNSISVVYDKNVINEGESWRDKLTEALEYADALLVFITDNSVSSSYVMNELGVARGTNKFILPLIYKDTPLPEFIKDIQAIFWNENLEEVAQKIVNAVKRFYNIPELFEKDQENQASEFDYVRNEELPQEFLKIINSKFYLVDTLWNGDEHFKRFIEQGIWENRFKDDSYFSLINEIDINDILIAKTTFGASNTYYLLVKGFGIVKENLHDGTKLKIDWTIINIEVELKNLSPYRDIIAVANFSDVAHILSYIDHALWKRLLPHSTSIQKTPNSIAGLISDSEKGIDYLAITKDIAAFARVIAAKSFEPPLAVALFGKWGSGKSFFMGKLKDEIVSLSRSNPYDAYCEGIAHIHFNAWSYMDANLWASIVTKIFDALYEYVSENGKTGEKKNIEKQLGEQLTIAKEEIAVLESKKSSVTNQIHILEKRKGLLEGELKTKIDNIEKKTLWNVIENVNKEFKVKEKISEALQESQSFLESEGKLKEIVPEKYWNDPKAAYEQAKSKYTFFQEFFSGKKIVWNIAALAFILTLIFLAPYFIKHLSETLRNVNFTIPQATLSFLVTVSAAWKRAESTYKKLQPLIASFWKIKDDFDKRIEEAVSKYEQQEKALKLEIEKDKAELVVVDQQIQQAVTLKVDLEFKINNALATEALHSFIERRAKSEDYKKHLGIISIIRRDFEILNDLFTEHNTEAKKIESAKEFRLKFKTPLERIILYIDDLNRCPEENVVQVLEAVNLLMAFPLFVVIVGVDPRWIKNALIKKHSLQFTGRSSPDESSLGGFESIEPSNYLEKIFQIPFHLKEAEKENVKEMIRKLAQVKPTIITETTVKSEVNKAVTMDNDEPVMHGKSETQNTSEPHEEAENQNKPAAIEISEKEVLLLQDMGEIIGSNPRAIKRFLNSYRIVKAHEDFTYDGAFEESELLVVMFLLALPISSYRKLLKTFEEFIEKDGNRDKPISLYLGTSNKIADQNINKLKQELDILLSGKRSYRLLQGEKAGAFFQQNAFVKRFTFKSL